MLTIEPLNMFNSRLTRREPADKLERIMQIINQYNEEMNKYLYLHDNDVLFDWFKIPNNLNTNII